MENQTLKNRIAERVDQHLENLNEFIISYLENEDGLTDEQRSSMSDTY